VKFLYNNGSFTVFLRCFFSFFSIERKRRSFYLLFARQSLGALFRKPLVGAVKMKIKTLAITTPPTFIEKTQSKTIFFFFFYFFFIENQP